MHNLYWTSSQISISIVRDNDEFWIRTVQSFGKGSKLKSWECKMYDILE